MVHPGHRSGACGTCKLRRIKCDEARPHCVRCQKARRTCLGYEGAFRIFNKNDKTVTTGDQPSGSGTTQVVVNDRHASVSPTTTSSSPCPTIALRGLWMDQAVQHFISTFVLTPTNRSYSRGYYAGLPALLRKTETDSVLNNTIRATAIALCARRTHAEQLAVEATELYCKAMRQLGEKLKHPPVQETDELRASIFLMGLYEMINLSSDDGTPWMSHFSGVIAFLKTCGVRSSPGHDLLFCCVEPDQIPSFIPNRPQVVSSSDEFVLVPPGLVSNSPVNLEAVIIKTQILFSTGNKLLASDVTPHLGLVRQLREAVRSADGDLALWPSCVPPFWQPRSIGWLEPFESSSVTSPQFWPGKVDVYLDLYAAAVWNTFRTIRLRLLDLLRRCSEVLQPEGTPYSHTREFKTISRTSQVLADELCASVPYCLIPGMTTVSDVDKLLGGQKEMSTLGGFLLAWNLFGAAICPDVPEHQRFWMRSMLQFIGAKTSVGLATALSETSESCGALMLSRGDTLKWAGSMV